MPKVTANLGTSVIESPVGEVYLKGTKITIGGVSKITNNFGSTSWTLDPGTYKVTFEKRGYQKFACEVRLTTYFEPNRFFMLKA